MPRQIGRAKARLEYGGLALVAAALKALPLERAVRLGARLADFAATVDRFNRPVAMRNLGIAFPDLDETARARILRASYRNWGRMAAEWLHSRDYRPDNIERFVTYDGIANLHVAEKASAGRGILALTGHFGNFELLSLAHALHGYRIAIIYRPLRNPLLDAAAVATRTRVGNIAIPRKGAGREVFRLLRSGWQVAVPLDLDVRRGVFVDFFSLKACTNEALARLAMMTGASVVPTFMIRQGTSARHHIRVLPMIEIVKTRDREESVRENTQRFTAVIESMIREHPDHWNWIHRRWKTRPPGEPRFY